MLRILVMEISLLVLFLELKVTKILIFSMSLVFFLTVFVFYHSVLSDLFAAKTREQSNPILEFLGLSFMVPELKAFKITEKNSKVSYKNERRFYLCC
jgi:hypothetical protein